MIIQREGRANRKSADLSGENEVKQAIHSFIKYLKHGKLVPEKEILESIAATNKHQFIGNFLLSYLLCTKMKNECVLV